MNIALFVAFLLLMPGLAGVIVPGLPSVPFMLVVALGYGIYDRFVHLTQYELLILGGLALLSIVIDYLAGLLGARLGGASKQSILAGFIGLIVGLILFPPLGAIIGLGMGIFLSELRLHQDEKRATKAATGGLIGSLTGTIINFVIALIFIGLFVFYALK